MADPYEELLKEYRRRNPHSWAAYQRARRSLPSGCTRNVLYYPPFPIYMVRGEGSKIWDVDGNEQIDLNFNAHPLSMAAGIATLRELRPRSMSI